MSSDLTSYKSSETSCNKNTANKNSGLKRTQQNRLMLVLNCSDCGKKNRDSFKINKSI